MNILNFMKMLVQLYNAAKYTAICWQLVCVSVCLCGRVGVAGVKNVMEVSGSAADSICHCNCALMSSSVSSGGGGLRPLKGVQALLKHRSAQLHQWSKAAGFPYANKHEWWGLFLDRLQRCVLHWGWINAMGLSNEETAGLCASAAERWKRKPRGETLTMAGWHRDA